MPTATLYDFGYRLARMPWEIGPRAELVDLVKRGILAPGRAVDLGCGTGANAIFLASHGFTVTGVDFSAVALAKAERAAADADVRVRLVRDDLTDLRHVSGQFDLLVDYGTFDDLSATGRDRYVRNVVPLAADGAQFLLWCFQWPPRRFDRLVGLQTVAPGEVAERFGSEFSIEVITATERPRMRRPIPGVAAYLLTRHARKDPS
jgi:SAM-dependent methyltransferase